MMSVVYLSCRGSFSIATVSQPAVNVPMQSRNASLPGTTTVAPFSAELRNKVSIDTVKHLRADNDPYLHHLSNTFRPQARQAGYVTERELLSSVKKPREMRKNEKPSADCFVDFGFVLILVIPFRKAREKQASSRLICFKCSKKSQYQTSTRED